MLSDDFLSRGVSLGIIEPIKTTFYVNEDEYYVDITPDYTRIRKNYNIRDGIVASEIEMYPEARKCFILSNGEKSPYQGLVDEDRAVYWLVAKSVIKKRNKI